MFHLFTRLARDPRVGRIIRLENGREAIILFFFRSFDNRSYFGLSAHAAKKKPEPDDVARFRNSPVHVKLRACLFIGERLPGRSLAIP